MAKVKINAAMAPNVEPDASGGYEPYVRLAANAPVIAEPYSKVFGVNQADSSFDAVIPTTTLPLTTESRGIIPANGRESALFLFYGTGADNTTFDYRIVGWQRYGNQWFAVPVCQGSATLSAVVGIAGQAIVNSERFADTLDVDFGIGVVNNSPVADMMPATLEVDFGPFTYLEVCVDMTGATNGNALYTTF